MLGTSQLDWQEAREMCKMYDADLMTINNSYTYDAVRQHLIDMGVESENATGELS